MKDTLIDLLPMEARSVDALSQGEAWVYEPKWDGFRCIAHKDGDVVELRSKSGKPLGRYFPDVVEMLQNLKARQFTLDGELVIETPSGLSFSELQLRLHPAASRVAKLAAATPASYVLFDLLRTPRGKILTDEPFAERRVALEAFHAQFCPDVPRLSLSPQTDSFRSAQRWLKDLKGDVDGLMGKDVTLPYQSGERVMEKFKPIKTVDCVVGGFRYNEGTKVVGSLLLGLYDKEGLLHHVGFTATIPAKEKPALTKKLEKIIAAPGFTGDAPGGPSRWSTERSAEWQPLKPKLVVEVAYDHVSDGRIRHGTKLLRWRDDKVPEQCLMDQITR